MRRKRVPSFLYIFSCILQRSLGKVCCLKQRSASHRSLIMPSFGLTSSSVGMALSLSLSLSLSRSPSPSSPLPLFPFSLPYFSYILSLFLLHLCAFCSPFPFHSRFVPVTSRSLSQPRSFLGERKRVAG